MLLIAFRDGTAAFAAASWRTAGVVLVPSPAVLVGIPALQLGSFLVCECRWSYDVALQLGECPAELRSGHRTAIADGCHACFQFVLSRDDMPTMCAKDRAAGQRAARCEAPCYFLAGFVLWKLFTVHSCMSAQTGCVDTKSATSHQSTGPTTKAHWTGSTCQVPAFPCRLCAAADARL